MIVKSVSAILRATFPESSNYCTMGIMVSRSTFRFDSPSELLRAFGRHKWKVAVFVCLTLSVDVAAILFMPRLYSSEAILFVRVGRESVTLDPTATTGQRVGLLDSRETEINSVVQILQSRALAEAVVDELGAASVLGERAESDQPSVAYPLSLVPDTIRRATSWIGQLDPLDKRERAVQSIQESLSVHSPKQSGVVSLSYTARRPKVAQMVAADLVRTFMAEHLRINRTAGSLEFFQSQSDRMADDWHAAAEKLRDTKNQLGLASPETRRNLLEEQISRLEEQLVAAKSARAASETKIAELDRMVSELPERVVTSEEEGYPNEALDLMREKLYELELQKGEVAAKLTDVHPTMIAISERVEQAHAILDNQEKARRRLTTSLNPAFEKVESDIITEKADSESLATMVDRLQMEIDNARGRITRLNDVEILIGSLQREAELAERNYLLHKDNLEQSRIDNALQNERISNINIVQPASFEPKPSSPQKSILAALGLAVSVLGSLLVVLSAEQFNDSLRTTEEVERLLELPVLMSLPRTKQHRLHVKAKQG